MPSTMRSAFVSRATCAMTNGANPTSNRIGQRAVGARRRRWRLTRRRSSAALHRSCSSHCLGAGCARAVIGGGMRGSNTASSSTDAPVRWASRLATVSAPSAFGMPEVGTRRRLMDEVSTEAWRPADGSALASDTFAGVGVSSISPSCTPITGRVITHSTLRRSALFAVGDSPRPREENARQLRMGDSALCGIPSLYFRSSPDRRRLPRSPPL